MICGKLRSASRRRDRWRSMSRAIDRQKEPDVPSPLSLIAILPRERMFIGASVERLPDVSAFAKSPWDHRSRSKAADPSVNRPIATRGRSDPCFCIALRGICISVNHCWIYVYDVEIFLVICTCYFFFLFPILFALPRGDRCGRRDRYVRS